MLHRVLGFTLSGGLYAVAAVGSAVTEQWSALVVGSALGTVAFLLQLRKTLNDNRYSVLIERLANYEIEVRHARSVAEDEVKRVKHESDKALKVLDDRIESCETDRMKLRIKIEELAARHAFEIAHLKEL